MFGIVPFGEEEWVLAEEAEIFLILTAFLTTFR